MAAAEPIASFAVQLARRLEAWASQIRDTGTAPHEGQSRLRAGRTWVDPSRLECDPALSDAIVRTLVQDLRAAIGTAPHALRRVEDAITTGGLPAARLLRAVLDRDAPGVDALARQTGVPTQVLHFLGAYLARPFLAAASREFDAELLGSGREGADCPVCGHEASLSFLQPENGARRLWCRHCGRGWGVPRVRCAFCANADAASLGYFEIEGLPGRRVDFCRRCRRYLKTFDLRAIDAHGDATLADLEDLTSAEMDAAAVAEGFTPPPASRASLPIPTDDVSTDSGRSP